MLIKVIALVVAVNSVVVLLTRAPWPAISFVVSLAVIGGVLVRERSKVK